MKFKSTKGMTNKTAPEGEVLIQYLTSFMGNCITRLGIGYYDNPNHIIGGKKGSGWILSDTGCVVQVIAYLELPEELKDPFKGKSKTEIIKLFNEFGSLK